MLWPAFLGGVVIVTCPHCGTSQAQPRGRGQLTCTQATCRKVFARAEARPAPRRDERRPKPSKD